MVSEAITDAENRADRLNGEMQGLEFQKKNAFKAPPKEWFQHRLDKFQETLDKNTKASALALKELLGSIEMEPVLGERVVENGQLIQTKPYYVAHTNIQTLALLDESQGSNWLHCRTREGPIRTAASLPFQVKIPCNEVEPLYQQLSQKVKELKSLGMQHEEIATSLQITRKTVGKALRHLLAQEILNTSFLK